MVVSLSLCLLFSFADSLYCQGDYARAITEYKRMLFAQTVETSCAFHRIGMSYKRSGKYDESIEYLRQAFDASPPESLEVELSLELADAYLRISEYPMARLELEGIDKPRATRLYAVSYLLEGDFKKAEKHLDSPDGELGTIAREGERLRFLNENRMVILSALLPGSGQLLSGHLGDGLLAFVLTASSGFFLYDALRDKRYLDASLIFGQLFSRFYMGNIRNTHRLATEENLRRKRTLLGRSELLREYLE